MSGEKLKGGRLKLQAQANRTARTILTAVFTDTITIIMVVRTKMRRRHGVTPTRPRQGTHFQGDGLSFYGLLYLRSGGLEGAGFGLIGIIGLIAVFAMYGLFTLGGVVGKGLGDRRYSTLQDAPIHNRVSALDQAFRNRSRRSRQNANLPY